MGKTLVAQTAAFDWETAASLGVDRSEWHRQVTNVRAQVIQQPTGRFNLYLIAPKDVPASVPDGLTILQGSSLRTYAYAEGPQGMRLEPSVDIIAQWQEILDRAMDLEQSTAYLESLVD